MARFSEVVFRERIGWAGPPNWHGGGWHGARLARINECCGGRRRSGIGRGPKGSNFFRGPFRTVGRGLGGLRGVPGSRSLREYHSLGGRHGWSARLDRRRRRHRSPPPEERLELRDRPKRSRTSAPLNKNVYPPHPFRRDCLLEIPEREKRQIMALRGLDRPPVCRRSAVLEPTHFELMAATRASHGRSAPADERVVEFVLSSATLALNVHRAFTRRRPPEWAPRV